MEFQTLLPIKLVTLERPSMLLFLFVLTPLEIVPNSFDRMTQLGMPDDVDAFGGK
jgi:hypothetical protein